MLDSYVRRKKKCFLSALCESFGPNLIGFSCFIDRPERMAATVASSVMATKSKTMATTDDDWVTLR